MSPISTATATRSPSIPGPGNAPIDDLVHARTGESFDRDGKLAARGKVHEEIVAKMLADPYFRLRPPKSLDREQFARLPLDALSTEDAAATATAIVAASIAKAQDHLPKPPANWIVAGGGARNPALMAMLRKRLPGKVLRADEVGWSERRARGPGFRLSRGAIAERAADHVSDDYGRAQADDRRHCGRALIRVASRQVRTEMVSSLICVCSK